MFSVFLQKSVKHQPFSHSWLQGWTPQSTEVLTLLQSTLEEQPSRESPVKSTPTRVSLFKCFTFELKKSIIVQKFAGPGLPRQCTTCTHKIHWQTQKMLQGSAVLLLKLSPVERLRCCVLQQSLNTNVPLLSDAFAPPDKGFYPVSPGTQETMEITDKKPWWQWKKEHISKHFYGSVWHNRAWN